MWRRRHGRITGKRLIPVVLVALLVLAAGACDDPSQTDDGSRLMVVTSTTVLEDLTRHVVGDDVSVVSVVPYDTDPHVYEPTPADARLVANADVLIANGANLEPWFASLTQAAAAPVLFVVETESLPVLFEEDGEPDPHLWMVPPFAANYVTAIAEMMAAVDTANASEYQQRAAAKRDVLHALDNELTALFATVPRERRVLVTSHDAFRYFGAHYGFEVASLYGISTETQPSARQVQSLIDLLRDQQIPTIFVETTIDQSVLERIAQDAGVEIGTPLYGDALGPPGSVADSYVAMMRHNAEAIVDGLR